MSCFRSQALAHSRRLVARYIDYCLRGFSITQKCDGNPIRVRGGDGAKKGAAAGFGLSLLTKGKLVTIPDGTLIVFRLHQPLTVDS